MKLLFFIILATVLVASKKHHSRRGGSRILPISLRNIYAAEPLNDTALILGDVYGKTKLKLPKSFNGAKRWPHCASVIRSIIDQSVCGSCWAVSSAAAFSDRLCVATNGEISTSMSALDLLGCCIACQPVEPHKRLNTCNGGFPTLAFEHIRKNGIVTGGGSRWRKPTGCKPYPVKHCITLKNGEERCPPKPRKNFKCTEDCFANSGFARNEKFYAGSKGKAYRVYDDTQVKNAMIDLMTHGSLVASFRVYEDFRNYNGKDIYSHHGTINSDYSLENEDNKEDSEEHDDTWLTDDESGSLEDDDDDDEPKDYEEHAVRIIGWGEEKDVPYWLVANSWGDKWGDKGFFKIRRGVNECGIESELVAVLVEKNKNV